MIELKMSNYGLGTDEENTVAFNKDGSLADTAPDSAKLLVSDLALLHLCVIGVDLDERHSTTEILSAIAPRIDDITSPTVVVLWNAAMDATKARSLVALLEAKRAATGRPTEIIVVI